ncbi:FKBP-type peptidyl-prolyl cis-trans isomerase [Flavobacterium sp.]|uniref:FKBP-type peptidyl-prolyl cis-trans isomerase n=1 Tax=Flavobacterium sp. TaxID=239 RepID=UPI0035285A7B
MKNVIKYLVVVLGIVIWVSCNSDDENYDPPRPYDEVYYEDIAEIEAFLKSNYVTYDADYNVEFHQVTNGETAIWDMGSQLKSMDINIASHGDFTYKLYYLQLNEGMGESPSIVDSVYIAYKGSYFTLADEVYTETVFENRPTPNWFRLDETITGWGATLQNFKSSDGFTIDSDGVVNFSNFGAGVMFIPSGLAYFSASTSAAPAYTPLIFSFKMYEQFYRDHDLDNVLSKYEISNDPYNNPLDTDGDGYYDYGDPDDDGDGKLTKNEVTYDVDNNVIIPFDDCDGDGIPNYLDTSDGC